MMWRMASVLPRNLFCRSLASSTSHRDDNALALSGEPINNNRSRDSSPIRGLTEDRAPGKRAHFKDEMVGLPGDDDLSKSN